ncbi:NAD-dependent succinate-semialdehyde dehydrogenase [Paraburkholderia fungorum]|uniref:NAD-dependent succinate-semialdehyde dehydrogenase n=1 Tax=Paraburkholderia fungorum TaxID=134537 RepID=UPI001C1EBB29|nr:NAD-dependent succinate-semialdehyde dehydrogenase [Paraburkholderia fungorum]MBU7435803.1 NAD-dependent succinate-semialdehyde dehydrogenase [Paraburkholderia fungorum]
MTQKIDHQQFAVSLNPANGEELKRYAYETEASLDHSLRLAEAGFKSWSSLSGDARASVLSKMAVALRRNIEALAMMATREMGKPVSQARAEVEKCAVLCDWYAEHGPAMLVDEKTSIENDKAFVSHLPIGGILAVMPWNFPYWQIMRGAVPILLGGNAYVLKHAPNVMGCAYLIQDMWAEAGLPEGAFAVINVTNDLVSKAILDSRIAAVAVTGSVRAGSAIAAQAGAALKKSVLELGGSDPFIVLADADLEGAVRAAVVGRFQNTGQICIAAKRIILEKPIQAEFTERFVAAVKDLKIGDPEAEDTYIGPMARYDLRDEMDGQVQGTIDGGATVLLGGNKIDGPGNYYEPTILTNVTPGMVSFDQEIFGPVASLITADDADQAIELANMSEFGLSGAIWTGDAVKAKSIARRLQTGGVFVNGFSASDPRVPIGGIKKSGYGRELSHFGVREFTNAQTVWFDRK